MHVKSHRLVALATAAGLSAALAVPAAFAQAPTPPTTPPGGSAQPPGTGHGGMGMSTQFHRLDTNRDGMVSKDEAGRNRDLTRRWDALDTNKDGMLDQGEFAAFETPASPMPKEKY